MKWELDYWNTGEWQVVEENLDDLTNEKIHWCPGKRNLFRAMDLVPFDKVKVVLVGQDPYPNPAHATGVAFSVPTETKPYPETLKIIFKELVRDLGVPDPTDGDLTVWCDEGVFLWNCIPSCTAFKSMSHDWDEYEPLTAELITKLSNSDRYIVFVFLGSVARRYLKYVNLDECDALCYTHPSPRGSMAKITYTTEKFPGSRMFSKINDLLCSHGEQPVDWRLH